MRLLLAFFALAVVGAADDGPLLLQKPTLSKTHIVFAFAGDLWSGPREGGDAVRLTSGSGNETDPVFSPTVRALPSQVNTTAMWTSSSSPPRAECRKD
jgi:hypothetical protein